MTTVFTLGYPDVPELRNRYQNLTLGGSTMMNAKMEVAQEEAWTFAIPVYIEFTDRNGGVGSKRRLESISDSVNASPEMRLN